MPPLEQTLTALEGACMESEMNGRDYIAIPLAQRQLLADARVLQLFWVHGDYLVAKLAEAKRFLGRSS